MWTTAPGNWSCRPRWTSDSIDRMSPVSWIDASIAVRAAFSAWGFFAADSPVTWTSKLLVNELAYFSSAVIEPMPCESGPSVTGAWNEPMLVSAPGDTPVVLEFFAAAGTFECRVSGSNHSALPSVAFLTTSFAAPGTSEYSAVKVIGVVFVPGAAVAPPCAPFGSDAPVFGVSSRWTYEPAPADAAGDRAPNRSEIDRPATTRSATASA